MQKYLTGMAYFSKKFRHHTFHYFWICFFFSMKYMYAYLYCYNIVLLSLFNNLHTCIFKKSKKKISKIYSGNIDIEMKLFYGRDKKNRAKKWNTCKHRKYYQYFFRWILSLMNLNICSRISSNLITILKLVILLIKYHLQIISILKIEIIEINIK